MTLPDHFRADPRHPSTLAIFYPPGMSPPAALDAIRAAAPELASLPTSHVSGPAWQFHGAPLDPTQQRQAALAASASRLATARAALDWPHDWPHDSALFFAHAAALGDDRPETLAALLAALDA